MGCQGYGIHRTTCGPKRLAAHRGKRLQAAVGQLNLRFLGLESGMSPLTGKYCQVSGIA